MRNLKKSFKPYYLFVIPFVFIVVSCGGGGGSVGPSAPASNPPNIAFVTSVSGTGDLSSWADAGGNTGTTAGDAICQARAQAAGLSGNFVAWLSDTSNDAYCRVNGLTGLKSGNCGQATLPADAGPWVRTDGFPFGGTIDAMATDAPSNHPVFVPIHLDESGTAITSNKYYFTNTNPNGVIDAGYNSCANWTDGASQVYVRGGYASGTSGLYTSGLIYCNATGRLLCLQTGAGTALPTHVSAGKKVFITSVTGTGDLSSWADAGGKTGIAAGDSICSARAAAAGLANSANFKAWLSDSTTDAKNRLASNGPWVTIDGVRVADNLADLIDGDIFTSINQDEYGAYGYPQLAATGTTAGGVKSTTHCSNWTDGTALSNITGGQPHMADTWWSQYVTSYPCDGGGGAYSLYCFED